MESSLSFVSRAKTALHSAAAKAEKVLTDIKSDLRSDRQRDGQSQRGVRKPSDDEMAGTVAIEKAEEEVPKLEAAGAEDESSDHNKYTVIQATVLRQLAVILEYVRSVKSIKELLTLAGDHLSTKEKTSLSFSAVKALVLREKDDRSNADYCNDEEFHSLIDVLFGSEEHILHRKIGSCSPTLPMMYLSKDIHSAPPGSFVNRLSEVIGGCKSLHQMASFWLFVVGELRRLWSEGQPIPHVPLEENPDLNSCLLHQQLQVINCCIARKRRRVIASESLDSVLKETSLDSKLSDDFPEKVYAKSISGHYILRLGADHLSENLTMLETGEPIYSPVTQEGPVLTEELIKETEEFVLRTRSVGAGCSQLLSDMQAFKAANPGCVLEDFVRWYSPPDWKETVSDDEAKVAADGEDSSSRRGRLSRRMQKEGNLWRELWDTAKPLPAIRQTPLFDEDLAVESILTTMEDIAPSQLFEQLFVSVLSSGFLIAEAALPTDSNLSKLFYECKDYVIAAYQTDTLSENLDDICKVYETVENIIIHPEAAILIMDQPEGATSGEPKSRFKKISLNFLGKDKQQLHKKATKNEKSSEEKQSHVFSHLFDKKPSLFSRKHSKSSITPPAVPSALDESDWTVI